MIHGGGKLQLNYDLSAVAALDVGGKPWFKVKKRSIADKDPSLPPRCVWIPSVVVWIPSADHALVAGLAQAVGAADSVGAAGWQYVKGGGYFAQDFALQAASCSRYLRSGSLL